MRDDVSVAHGLKLASAFLALMALCIIGGGIAQNPPEDGAQTTVVGVEITDVDFDDEWIEITNLGPFAQDFTGWSLQDEQKHSYTFPEGFLLDPNESVKVHTGNGIDSSTDLYWNRNGLVWNNDGDVATLFDESGEIIDRYPE